MSTSTEQGSAVRQCMSLPQQQHGAQQWVIRTPSINTLHLLKKRQKLALQHTKRRFF